MSSSPPPTVSSRRLRPLRILWILILIVSLSALLASVPILWQQGHEICTKSSCNGSQIRPDQLRALRAAGLSLDIYAGIGVAVNVVFGCIYAAIGALIFLHRSGERMALLSSYFLVIFGSLTFPGTTEALASEYPSLTVPAGLVTLLGAALLALFFFLFPNGRFVPRWSAWLVPVLPLLQAPSALFPNSPYTLDQLPPWLGIGPFLGILVFMIGTQVYRFRRVSNAIERQQTKWVLLGVGTGLTGFVAFVLASVVLPPSAGDSVLGIIVPVVATYGFMLLIPLSIALAILRYNLWEADVLINRALVYGSLTLSLAALYIGGVVGLQALSRAFVGQSSDLAIALATLVVAALFNPWRRRLQVFIDRRFYRHKYDASRILSNFSARLRDEVDLDHLAGDLATVVNDTVQPVSVALWLRHREESA